MNTTTQQHVLNTMETIQIIRINGRYFAKTSKADVIAVFGTDTIPTPFTDQTPLAVVLAEIKALNPESHVFA